MTSNVSFKLKLIKRYDNNGWENDLNKKIDKKLGLYEQLNSANRVTYNHGNFSLKMLKEAFNELYNKKEKNEYRKKFCFRSKIFKQTYKFG